MWQYSNYSKISPVAQRNFPFKNPRDDQLETISEIIDAINRGYKYIILEAGTGTGKSAIAATLSSIYDSSYILTVTKQLLDQYLEDFTNMSLVKGRKNFRCRRDMSLTVMMENAYLKPIHVKTQKRTVIIISRNSRL